MKKSILHITLIVFLGLTSLLVNPFSASSQGVVFENSDKGVFINRGTFRVKNGDLKNMNETIGGRVEFTNNSQSTSNRVPNIQYNQLFFLGKTPQYIHEDVNKGKNHIVVMDTLYIADSVRWIRNQLTTWEVRHAVVNNSKIYGNQFMEVNNQAEEQTLDGQNGRFTKVDINNPQGVSVVQGSSLTILNTLKLTKGTLKYDSVNNFNIQPRATIIRYPEGSLQNAPNFTDQYYKHQDSLEIDSDPEPESRTVNVTYMGNGEIVSGPEIPDDNSILQNLRVENTNGGLLLGKSFTVNDTLYVGTNIDTEGVDEDNVLTYTNDIDPQFNDQNSHAEIAGKLNRTNLTVLFNGDSIIFNNPHTWVRLSDVTTDTDYQDIQVRVKPFTFPDDHSNGQNEELVQRFYEISGNDSQGAELNNVNDLAFAYAWKYHPDRAWDESNDLDRSEVVLLRWGNSQWAPYPNDNDDRQQYLTSDSVWVTAWVDDLSEFGFFAMGLPASASKLAFLARAFLEGAYRQDKMEMSTELKDRDLLPMTPPDMYPYKLDDSSQSLNLTSIPDNVVDYVVLEFRAESATLTGEEDKYITAFLLKDGQIVDIDGVSPVALKNADLEQGDYKVALRHRNHLAIETEDYISFKEDSTYLDFTDFSILLGREDAIKPIGTDASGSVIYGLIAGESNADKGIFGEIDYDNDIMGAWNLRTYRAKSGDYVPYSNQLFFDYSLDGIITTKDFNYAWNNKGKLSQVK